MCADECVISVIDDVLMNQYLQNQQIVGKQYDWLIIPIDRNSFGCFIKYSESKRPTIIITWTRDQTGQKIKNSRLSICECLLNNNTCGCTLSTKTLLNNYIIITKLIIWYHDSWMPVNDVFMNWVIVVNGSEQRLMIYILYRCWLFAITKESFS